MLHSDTSVSLNEDYFFLVKKCVWNFSSQNILKKQSMIGAQKNPYLFTVIIFCSAYSLQFYSKPMCTSGLILTMQFCWHLLRKGQTNFSMMKLKTVHQEAMCSRYVNFNDTWCLSTEMPLPVLSLLSCRSLSNQWASLLLTEKYT